MSNTIILKPKEAIGRRYDEGRAAGAITPGHLIMQDGNGEWVVQANAAAVCEAVVAIEDALIGKTIDDAYADDDLVRMCFLAPGDVVNLLLKAGENADEDDFLTPHSDGTVKVVTSTNYRMFVPIAAVDNSLGATPVRIKARKL